MTTSLQRPFGYVDVAQSAATPLGPKGTRFLAHEFHYSRLQTEEPSALLVSKPGREPVPAGMLRKACHKLNKDRAEYPSCDLASAQPRLPDSLYVYYFAWLYSNKGVVLGRLVGASLRADEIPPAFVRVIQAAGRLAKVNNR